MEGQSPEITNSPHENTAFTSQFEARHKSKTENGAFQYAHMKPTESIGSPVIFHPGWTGDVKVCKSLAEESFALHQDLYILDLIGHAPPKTADNEPYDKYTLRNAQAIAQIAIDNGEKEINLAGHSEGASVSLLAAKLLLEQGYDVKNIVLVSPVGFGLKKGGENDTNTPLEQFPNETDTLFHFRKKIDALISKFKGPTTAELTRRGIEMLLQEKEYKDNGMAPKVPFPVGHIVRHPGHVFNEFTALANLDMSKLVEVIVAKGVNVSIIQSENDPLVHHEDINTEFQLAAQAVRQSAIEQLRVETVNDPSEMRQEKYARRAKELEEQENQHVITTAIGKPGHLFTGHHPRTFMPLVIDMIRNQDGQKTA